MSTFNPHNHHHSPVIDSNREVLSYIKRALTFHQPNAKMLCFA
uniref:Uncharacterized protein n=1 Tax=Arundo donax TaxID=35708 RepID=A0A0A9HEC7_ARUDO